MARRDEDWLDVCTRANNCPYRFSLKLKPTKRASFPSYFAMVTDQSSLGAPYGGNVEKQTHVRSQSQASGMGNALAIEEHNIGTLPEKRKGP